ncbi:DNA mismatch endonuclease Vsr [Jiangella asiatica]
MGTSKNVPPAATDAATLRRMKNTRQRDTTAEVALRRELFRRRLRYRIDQSPIPGTRRRADIVFRKAKLAVFVDGCFWHCCPEHGTKPKANAEWWATKLAANVQRDRAVDAELRAAGWAVIRVWEHEDVLAAADLVAANVKARLGRGGAANG